MTGPWGGAGGRGARLARAGGPHAGERRGTRTLACVALLLAAGACLDGGSAAPDRAPAGADETPERSSPTGEPLLVLAAASLNVAMPELIERFAAHSGVRASLVLGATGNLAAQIEHGAPADLFFSADEATVVRLVRGGRIRPSTVRGYAVGQLVVVWRSGVGPPESLAALAGPPYQVVAIANPEHAPYGAAAREAFERLGVWPAFQPRIVQGENVAQAYQMVRTGNADAAVVARSVLDVGARARDFLAVDAALHAPLLQSAGVVEGSTHPAAEAFLAFVVGDEGQAVLARHGLAPAPALAPTPAPR